MSYSSTCSVLCGKFALIWCLVLTSVCSPWLDLMSVASMATRMKNFVIDGCNLVLSSHFLGTITSSKFIYLI